MNRTSLAIRLFFVLVVFFIGITCQTLCFGHDWPVHIAITTSAYQASEGINAFLNENLESSQLTASQPQAAGTHLPSVWLQLGSIMEDEQR